MASQIDFKKELEERAKEIDVYAGTDKSPIKPLKPARALKGIYIHFPLK